jgi:hypothetical protein
VLAPVKRKCYEIRMAVSVRADEEQPEGSALIIHGGQGALNVVRDAAIEYYPEYRSIRDDGFGSFMLSVYATVNGVGQEEITERLVHKSYGIASVSSICSGFDLMPTSFDDEDMPEEIMWLQICHFDICLPDLPDPRLIDLDPWDDQDLLAACEDHLVPHLEALLGLFTRHRKT